MHTPQARVIRRHLKGLLAFLVVITLIASLILNAFSWTELKRTYTEMKSVRLDPLGRRETKFPETVPAAAAPNTPLVLIFGDSRARVWPAPAISGLRFANRGIDSQTTEQAIGRFGDEVSSLKPDVIVLECGINDLTAIGVLPERRDAIVSRCRQNLHDMITIGRNSGAAVIVVTVFPTGEVSVARRPFWSDQIAGAVKAVNDDLREIRQPKVSILDADQILLENGQIRRSDYQDTLHLTGRGYERLNVAIEKLLHSRP